MPVASQAETQPANNEPPSAPASKNKGVEPWHARPAEAALEHFAVDPEVGLPDEEVERRFEAHGPNRLASGGSRSAGAILLDQFRSVVILVLVPVGVLAFILGDFPEGIAIAAVVLVNTLIGFFSEAKAQQSMEALRRLGEQAVRVRRGGKIREVTSDQLVPGDIVPIEAETLAPADLRVLSTKRLRVNEAALTGESVPVTKRAEPSPSDAPLAERPSMLFKGTTAVEGSASALVVATGMDTELGRISKLATEAESTETPLQRRLDALGKRMALIVGAVAVIVAGAGVLAGRELRPMIETAIALGVAAIPEGLPIVATIALARGMWVMARRNALVNRLPAVETLGATQVIFTDKTGTLTENSMEVRAVVTPGGEHHLGEDRGDAGEDAPEDVRRAVEIGVLCNSASLGPEGEDGDRGDPTEIALLRAGLPFDMTRDELLEATPEIRQTPFDSDVMMMATFHRGEDGVRVAVKGAPDEVLKVCTSIGADTETLEDADRDEWRKKEHDLAERGLRVLAVAEKTVDDKGVEPYRDLTFCGLVAMLDPPRTDVKAAIDECQSAGIRVVMVTGDQPATAEAIAEAVGIVGGKDDPEAQVVHGRELRDPDEMTEDEREHVHRSNIFARVSPEQKLDIVHLYQRRGETVAMTGDGVNDAPALKKADIGVAMGQRGTDAAKQVSDMVLTDDRFESIVAAVRQGRIIFDNIRKSALFMLCTNAAEVLVVGLVAVAGSVIALPLPLEPLQILYLNVLTDVFPAMALAVGAGEPGIMRRAPRRSTEGVLARRHWLAIGGWAIVLGACVLLAVFSGARLMGLSDRTAVTMSFLTLGFGKLWFVFNLRSRGSGFVKNAVTTNPWIWASIVFCAGLLLLAVYLPGLSSVLKTTPLGLRSWGIVLGLSLIPFLVGQVLRGWQRFKGQRSGPPKAEAEA